MAAAQTNSVFNSCFDDYVKEKNEMQLPKSISFKRNNFN